MYFTWNFLARIFVIYIATRSSCDRYLSMFTITMPFPHETKLLCKWFVYLSHSECGEFNRLCTLPFFASMGLCFLGTWAMVFFKNASCFDLDFDIWQSISAIYWFIGTCFQRISFFKTRLLSWHLIYQKALIISGYTSLIETWNKFRLSSNTKSKRRLRRIYYIYF